MNFISKLNKQAVRPYDFLASVHWKNSIGFDL